MRPRAPARAAARRPLRQRRGAATALRGWQLPGLRRGVDATPRAHVLDFGGWRSPPDPPEARRAMCDVEEDDTPRH